MNARLALATAVVMTALAGCQTYQSRPLELTDYADQWAKRPLDVESIEAYAAALGDSGTSPTPFDSSDGLSLYEAEAVALHFNPELRMIRAAANVPLASAKEAGWWPDPQFEAEVLRFVDRGDRTRFKMDAPSIDGINAGGLETTPAGFRRVQGDYIDDPWIVGAGLSITIPISGRIAVEKDLRWSQYSAAWRRILLNEWELVTRLRSAWLEWSSSGERLRITQDYVEKLAVIAKMTEHLVAAGEMKPTEGRLIGIELARRQTALLTLQQNEIQNRLALLAMMGLVPDSPIVLQPQLSLDVDELPSDRRADLVLQTHPRIKSVKADYEASEQQLRLEIRKQYPDLDLGPSYSFEEGFSRFGLGVGFPIPLWNRNRQAVAEARALRDQARVTAEATAEQVLSNLARVEQHQLYASQRRGALLERVAPLVEKQVEDSRTLLDLGEVDVLLLRDALTGSLDTKLEVIDAALAEQRALNELQQMLQPRWFTPSQLTGEED